MRHATATIMFLLCLLWSELGHADEPWVLIPNSTGVYAIPGYELRGDPDSTPKKLALPGPLKRANGGFEFRTTPTERSLPSFTIGAALTGTEVTQWLTVKLAPPVLNAAPLKLRWSDSAPEVIDVVVDAAGATPEVLAAHEFRLADAKPKAGSWAVCTPKECVYRIEIDPDDANAILAQDEPTIIVENELSNVPDTWTVGMERGGTLLRLSALDAQRTVATWNEQTANLKAEVDAKPGATRVGLDFPGAGLVELGDVTCGGATCARVERKADGTFELDFSAAGATRQFAIKLRDVHDDQWQLELKVRQGAPPRFSVIGSRAGDDLKVTKPPKGYEKFCPPGVQVIAAPWPHSHSVSATKTNNCDDQEDIVLYVFEPAALGTNAVKPDDLRLRWDTKKPKQIKVDIVGGAVKSNPKLLDPLKITSSIGTVRVVPNPSGPPHLIVESNEDLTETTRVPLEFDLSQHAVAQPLFNFDGNPIDDSGHVSVRAEKWRVETLQSAVVSAEAPRGSSAAVSIATPVARLLEVGQVLTSGTDKTATVASVDRARSSAVLLLNPKAVDVLRAANGELELSGLTRLDLPSDTAATLKLQTIDCEFTITPLHRGVAGIHDGELTLHATVNDDACFGFPLNVGLGEGESGVVLAPRVRVFAGASSLKERLLQVDVRSSEDTKAGATARLVFKYDNDRAVRLGGQQYVPIRFEDGVVADEAVIEALLPGDPDWTEQPVLGVGRRNRITLPRTLEQAWELRLLEPSNHGACTLFEASVVDLPLDERATASRASTTDSGVALYCVEAKRQSTSVPVELVLRGKLRGIGSGAVPSWVPELVVDLGQRRDSIARKARTIQIPLRVRDAEMVCRKPNGNDRRPIRANQPARAMRHNGYTCRFRVALPAGVSDPNELIRSHGAQHLEAWIDWESGGTTTGNFESEEKLKTFLFDGGTPPGVSVVPDDSGGYAMELALEDVLEDYRDKVTDYRRIRVKLRHSGTTDASGALHEAHVPDRYLPEKGEELRLTTRLLPRKQQALTLLLRRKYDDQNNIGLRFYATLLGGFSVLRTPNNGIGIDTSSAFAQPQTVEFEYGALAVTELWDFSNNQPLLRGFTPQLHIGCLLPKQRPDFFQSFSFIVGGGIRLPMSTTPSEALAEAQVTPAVWLEVSKGQRDGERHHALLLGINLFLGSLGS